MADGIVFDIKEFSINDGPNVRVTVFMKGCPLRCLWCHNPEGLTCGPQYNNQTGKLVGQTWTSGMLTDRILTYRPFFEQFGGGVTFSGGEPTMQAEFLLECAEKLPGVHKLLDTSGYCEETKFSVLASAFDMYYFDLKLADDTMHQKYTGVSNKKILNNLSHLMQLEKNTVLRMPMIPAITDTPENLEAVARLIEEKCSKTVPVHLLPYNSLAGGKYPIYNMVYPLKAGYTKNNTAAISEFQRHMECIGYNIINYVKGES